MKQIITNLLKILRNEAFIFVIGKYFAFALQLANAILIAKILGPYYFGIYGFVFLFIRIIRYFNTGVHYSVNVKLSTHDRSNIQQANNIAGTGLLLYIITTAILLSIGFLIHFFDISLFPKYNFSSFIIIVAVIVSLILGNLLFTNIYRSYSRFYEMILYFVLPQLFLLIALFISPEDNRLLFLFYSFAAGHAVAFVLYLFRCPLKLKVVYRRELAISLIKTGFTLAVFNAAFYFIILATRTIVSIYYSVETMGLFSFANNVAQITMNFIGVIGFVFFPKILNRMRESAVNKEVIMLLNTIQTNYKIILHLLVFVLVFTYSVIMHFMPEYKDSEVAFLFLIMTQLLVGMIFGYSHLLIARGYEHFIARYALITLIFSIAVALLLIHVFSIGYTGVAISTFGATCYYMLAVIRKGKGIIDQNTNVFFILKEIFPLKFALPLAFLLIERVFLGSVSTSLLPLVMLIIFNWHAVIDVFYKFIKLFSSIEYTKF